MLYDDLVHPGKYLAHYGVTKDKWSPEARARHNRNHPQKTRNNYSDSDPVGRFLLGRRTHERVTNDYYNDNYNRGGHRSFGNKVDEHRFENAETNRRRNGGSSSNNNLRTSAINGLRSMYGYKYPEGAKRKTSSKRDSKGSVLEEHKARERELLSEKSTSIKDNPTLSELRRKRADEAAHPQTTRRNSKTWGAGKKSPIVKPDPNATRAPKKPRNSPTPESSQKVDKNYGTTNNWRVRRTITTTTDDQKRPEDNKKPRNTPRKAKK